MTSPNKKIRVGLVGCGERGAYDAKNCLSCSQDVELTAMADLFEDRLQNCLQELKKEVPEKVNVPAEHCFLGFDSFRKLLDCDIEMVMLITPPHFRPMQFKAAVEAGRHIFMEKPVAVDPPGVHSIIESSKEAGKKNLKVVVGTQMRRIAHIAPLMERVHRGDIGEIVGGQCVRIGDAMRSWRNWPETDCSDMERQIRWWLFYVWLSGDFIVEQHVHNLDLMNWAFGSHPIKCHGMGGRQARTAAKYGNVYDHFAVEYEYPNGARIEYIGAQIDGCTFRNDHYLEGTKGIAYFDFANAFIEAEVPFKYEGEVPDPCVTQHAEHIEAICKDTPLNEGKRIAESTLTAIMGRISVYTGRAISWDWALNSSELKLGPSNYQLGPVPVAPVAVPGQTKLV